MYKSSGFCNFRRQSISPVDNFAVTVSIQEYIHVVSALGAKDTGFYNKLEIRVGFSKRIQRVWYCGH